MATLKLNDQQVPFDDSNAITRHVDVVTENVAADGIVYFGLGALKGLLETEEIQVDGIAHLRMTPRFARMVAGRLVTAAKKAEEQLLKDAMERSGPAN
jgi:hypothetical protein